MRLNTTSGILIGGLLGFISAFGYLNMNVKKSQWSTTFPVVALITTVAGAFTGGKICYNYKRSRIIDQALGLDNIHYSHIKIGRNWESLSTWTDCKGNSHRLKTIKDTRNTASYFDGGLLINHGTSASSVNISKYHNEARNEAFKKMREKHGEECLRYLKEQSKAG
jgi:hypothetical protein